MVGCRRNKMHRSEKSKFSAKSGSHNRTFLAAALCKVVPVSSVRRSTGIFLATRGWCGHFSKVQPLAVQLLVQQINVAADAWQASVWRRRSRDRDAFATGH